MGLYVRRSPREKLSEEEGELVVWTYASGTPFGIFPRVGQPQHTRVMSGNITNRHFKIHDIYPGLDSFHYEVQHLFNMRKKFF
jgi:hypothetical protein